MTSFAAAHTSRSIEDRSGRVSETAHHLRPEPGGAQASASYHCAHFTDPDEQAAGAGSSFPQRYEQLSCGRFRGEMTRIDVPDGFILRELTNQRIIQVGQSLVDIAVFWVWSADGQYRCNGRLLDLSTPLILGRGSVYEVLADPAQAIAIQIGEDAFRSWCEAVEGFEPGDLVQRLPTRRLPTVCALGMQRGFREFFEVLERQPALSAQANWRADVRDALLRFAATAMGAPSPGEPHPGRRESNYARVVARARSYIEDNKDRRLSVADLCRQAGTSRRNLHYAFVNALGVTPSSYLRAVRLNAARRDIRRRADEGETLADIAARWGFFHLSNFAVDYRRRFGELPSQTVRIGS